MTVTEPNWNQIPSEVLGYRETYTNCTSLQQSITFKHSESSRVGSRISKTKVIASAEKLDAKVDFKFTDAFAGGLSVGFSKTVTITSNDEQNYERYKDLDATIPLHIAVFTRVVMDHLWIRREVPIQYTGTVTVDSPVAANLENIYRISQVLTNPVDRTFEFAGVVTSSTLLEGDTRPVETKLTAAECESTPGFRTKREPYRAIYQEGRLTASP